MKKRTSAELVVNPEYLDYATKHMEIDEDSQGLYCIVPSQRNVHAPEPYNEQKYYVVRCDESMLVPVAVECECPAYEHYRRCRHAIIVNTFFKRIYRSNVAKIEQKRMLEAPLNGNKGFSLMAS